jgi:hypothetical protein
MADKTPQDILKEAVETAEILKDAFTSLGATIKSQLTANLMDADDYTKQYIKSLKSGVGSLMSSLGKSGDKLIDNQLKLNKGQLSSKDISKQLEELESKKLRSLNQVLTARKNEWISSDESRKLYDQINESIEEGKKGLEDQAKAALKIENNVGVLGRAVKGLNKIPVLGNLIESEKVLADIQESAAKKGANRLTTLGAGLTSIGKSIGKNLFDPLTAITFLLNSAFKADKQVTALAKSLVITKGAAEGIRQEFVDASRAIGDSFITTDKLLESQTKLSDQLGITKIQSIGLNKEFTTLTGKIGLSEEAAGGLAKISIASGKAARQVTTNTIASIEKVKQETGLRLNNQKILEATGKVSGQLLANFRANPAAIAEAIAKTQALGTSLEQAKAQGESLLNFESSIENELKAELVTGKQINLERARMAALMGDQKTVAEELSAQAVDFNTFSNMNVIAQKSLAEALGTSADALSDQLFKQQYLNKSKEEIIALGGEEAAQRMEALSAQDKFNSAVTKLQDLLGNVMAGPLGQIIDGMANIASSATAVRGAFIAIAAVSLAKTIGSIATMAATLATSAVAGTTLASSLTLGLGAIAIVGSIAAIIGAMNSASDEAVSKSQQVQDGIAPSNKGPFTITDNFGATAITSAGDSLAVSPNINRNNNILGGGASVDLTPMIAAINEVKAAITQLGSRPSVAYINGKDAFSRDVSTTSVQNTYKLA